MSFSLQTLGSYKVERTEDYDEMIRVKGSKPEPPHFMAPSHLYKYSEAELGLYLKDHKNTWRALANALNIGIDVSEEEILLHFPISMFPKIASIIKFVKKRGNGIQSDAFKEARSKTQFRKKYGGKVKQNEVNFKIKD